MRKRNEVVSIFGQVEEVVAEQMICEGKASKLAPTPIVSLTDIPESTQTNDRGEKVRLVIVLSSGYMREFNRRIGELLQ